MKNKNMNVLLYVTCMMTLFLLFVGGCAPDNQAQNQGFEQNDAGNLGRGQNQFGAGNRGAGQGVSPLGQQEGAPAQEFTQLEQYSLVLNNQPLDTAAVFERDGNTYVSLEPVLTGLGYEVQSSQEQLQAGFTDVLITCLAEGTIIIEDENLQRENVVFAHNEHWLVTLDTLEQMLTQQTGSANVAQQETAVNVVIEDPVERFGFQEGETLDNLPEDDDAFDLEGLEGVEGEALLNELQQVLNHLDDEDVPVVAGETADRILRDARGFMGVPYEFGARPGQTRTFDCSSFTQYLYRQQGISLPRVSRHQAQRGTYVPVSELRKGDLLFFYWPGRFASNRIVGHVGIYAGNGYMIHSAPVPRNGVQIENLKSPNSRYRPLYLGAKRVR